MSVPTTRKPVSNTSSSGPLTEGSPSRVISSAPSTTGQGLARNPSIRQSRLLRKAPNRTSSSYTQNDPEMDVEEDDKTSNAQLIADLKEQVQRAEKASDQYRKQLEVMQQRLDDISNEQTAGEERDFQRQTEIDRLRAEIKDSIRHKRDMEVSHDSEKRMLLQEREIQATKEAELQAVIGRLNDALRLKSLEISSASRATSISLPQVVDDDNNQPKNPSFSVDDYLRTIQEKDKIIEAMRLDMAEFHLNAAQQEHVGDGRLQILEKEILETKMQNARLVEENESFQMLLSEKTLKGDFLHDSQAMDYSSGMNTLAEELEYAGDESEGQTDAYKKLDIEMKALKESNKALTLYIDKIIGRLLQHEGFEHIILDKEAPPEPPEKSMPLNKALPATPSATDQNTPSTAGPPAAGFLQRARSVVSRPGAKARPVSYIPPPSTGANENPDTAPSIPLNRGHRRARSDQAQQDLGAAAVVQQMNRGSPLRTVSGGPLSPGMSPLAAQLGQNRASYFPAAPPPASSTHATSGSQGGERSSSRNSIASGESLERDSTDASSAQNSAQGIFSSNTTNLPGAVMRQNQLRPLRLVQEQSREDEEAQKRANRGSWIGWFKGSTIEAQDDERL